MAAPVGGVMTDEVGAVTDELQLRMDPGGVVRVAYAGSSDWLTVSGGPVPGWSLEDVRKVLSSDWGVDEAGNPRPTML